MHEFHTTRRIDFSDTDMAGIVHFARFFVFMESAEHEFLRALGTPVHFDHEGEEIGWPRAAASCEYKSPARLGDVLDIRVSVARKGNKSITWGFEFRRQADGTLLAVGRISAICCGLGRPSAAVTTKLRALPIPPQIADQLEETPQ